MKLRGCLPDAVKKDRIFLFKACSRLRLTYEIRIAAYFAKSTSRVLTIDVRKECILDKALIAFANEQGIDLIQG
jgi:hypothetical protein